MRKRLARGEHLAFGLARAVGGLEAVEQRLRDGGRHRWSPQYRRRPVGSSVPRVGPTILVVVSICCSVRLPVAVTRGPIARERRRHVFIDRAGCGALGVELRIVLVGLDERAFHRAGAGAAPAPPTSRPLAPSSAAKDATASVADVASAIARALHATARRPRALRNIHITPRDQTPRDQTPRDQAPALKGRGPRSARTLGTKVNHNWAGRPWGTLGETPRSRKDRAWCFRATPKLWKRLWKTWFRTRRRAARQNREAAARRHRRSAVR